MSEKHCKLCDHVWQSRKDHPLACPRCKRYDWDGTADYQVRDQMAKAETPGVDKDFDFGS